MVGNQAEPQFAAGTHGYLSANTIGLNGANEAIGTSGTGIRLGEGTAHVDVTDGVTFQLPLGGGTLPTVTGGCGSGMPMRAAIIIAAPVTTGTTGELHHVRLSLALNRLPLPRSVFAVMVVAMPVRTDVLLVRKLLQVLR